MNATSALCQRTRDNFCLLIIALIAVSLAILTLEVGPQLRSLSSSTLTASEKSTLLRSTEPLDTTITPLSLSPGDLPGYTGWARPTFTLAPWFERVDVPTQAIAGQTYHATVQCQGHVLCWAGADRPSFFDVRAYGPAIVTGPVYEVVDPSAEGLASPTTTLLSRQYELSLHFLDAGVYTLEWVLALSVTPVPLDAYPIKTEPAYEGYLLPGFPFTVVVLDATSQDIEPALPSWWSYKGMSSWWPPLSAGREEAALATYDAGVGIGEERTKVVARPICQANDILDHTLTSALEKGRWVVQEKVSSRSFQLLSDIDEIQLNQSDLGDKTISSTENTILDTSRTISLSDYQRGINSVGFRMAYLYQNCSLPTLEELKPAMDSRRRHLIFVGDSNMVRQVHVSSDQGYKQIQESYVKVSGGLVNLLPQVQETFLKIREQQENEGDQVSYHIIFNSGLHDIAQMCTAGRGERYAKSWSTTVEGLPRCAASYRRLLTDLAATIKQFPAQSKVFQTTTAGWPKWGNYGFAWPPNGGQPFPQSPQYVEYFNTIAWEVMQEAGVPVVDAFWKTRTRADHREVNEGNDIGKHMAHAGPEIYDLLVREFFQLVVESDENNIDKAKKSIKKRSQPPGDSFESSRDQPESGEATLAPARTRESRKRKEEKVDHVHT